MVKEERKRSKSWPVDGDDLNGVKAVRKFLSHRPQIGSIYHFLILVKYSKQIELMHLSFIKINYQIFKLAIRLI